jgi:phosphoribosyl-ATP pyrophosphohydrolase/phosphoribosyl-AMP cyclohydrolase
VAILGKRLRLLLPIWKLPCNDEEDGLMNNLNDLKFNEQGLIPAIVQDINNKDVLMMAYMNSESLQKTLQTGNTWFFSRSRQALWMKGETSGNTQLVKDIKYDCDNDTLLLLVEPAGPACHTGERTCFHRNLTEEINEPEEIEELKSAIEGNVLEQLYELIAGRQKEMPEGSYTTQLFTEGLPKIKAKVEEESDEVLEAADEDDKEHFIYEVGDLIYHLLVLMVEKEVTLDQVKKELHRRRK